MPDAPERGRIGLHACSDLCPGMRPARIRGSSAESRKLPLRSEAVARLVVRRRTDPGHDRQDGPARRAHAPTGARQVRRDHGDQGRLPSAASDTPLLGRRRTRHGDDETCAVEAACPRQRPFTRCRHVRLATFNGAGRRSRSPTHRDEAIATDIARWRRQAEASSAPSCRGTISIKRCAGRGTPVDDGPFP